MSNPRDQWADRNARLALRCEAIVKRLDPARIVYHHSSGNLSAMYTLNFYPNFVPIQELDDWFEHWSIAGDKPMVLVEYGAPFGWDWAMYRGWYNGQREFGSAAVPWEYCLAEWNAQFLGDAAYQISDREKRNLRWEAQQFRAGARLVSLGLPLPGGRRAVGRDAAGASRLHDRQLAGVPRLGACRPTRPGSTTASGNCATGSSTAARICRLIGITLQQPGYSPDFIDQHLCPL